MERKLFIAEEELSIAQAYLNSLADKRELKNYWNKNLKNKGFNFFYLYNVMVGKVPPSIDFIWSQREVINPVNWFYTTKERKPQAVQINDKPVRYSYYKSKNFLYIANLKNLYVWCTKHNLTYNTIWYLKKKKRKITFQRMKDLKDILPIRNWFIFL